MNKPFEELQLTSSPAVKIKKVRTFRKHLAPGEVIEKIKLWPSRNGILHGIKSIKIKGNHIFATTHCGQELKVKNSRTGRAARWLRNKWYAKDCPRCRIPEWKIEKYSQTRFQ